MSLMTMAKWLLGISAGIFILLSGVTVLGVILILLNGGAV